MEGLGLVDKWLMMPPSMKLHRRTAPVIMTTKSIAVLMCSFRVNLRPAIHLLVFQRHNLLTSCQGKSAMYFEIVIVFETIPIACAFSHLIEFV